MYKRLLYWFGLILTMLIALPVFADDYGTANTAKASGLSRYGKSLFHISGNIVSAVLSLVGIIFFILMLYGGFEWMTSRGKEDQTKKSLEIIWGGVIGLMIVLAAYAITMFMTSNIIMPAIH